MNLKDDPRIREVLKSCYQNTKAFCKVVFPERFSRPFSSLTDQLFDILDNPNIQKAVIAAPRGWGKTSIFNMAYPAKKILFREAKFIVPISCTATQAVTQGENLKRKLQTSALVRELFGEMKSETFSKDLWITSTGTMVLPRGAGQQVRGILSGDDRPDLIIVDDLEDSEAVKNDEQRKKLKEWFFSDVVNIVDRGSKDWKIVVIGTVLHEDALLVNLLEDPDWFSVKLELCDDNFRSNWPDFMSDDEVRALAESYAKKGLLHLFFMEYRNSVITTDAPFQQQFFKYYEEKDHALNVDRDVDNFVIIDPAKTTNMASDYSAIVGIGANMRNQAIYVRDIINEKLHPDELYEKAFAMCKRLNARVLGVEVTGLNEFITHPLKTWITRKGLVLELIELKARGGSKPTSKEDRVRALVPFYRQGLIYHNKAVCAPLEAQLISFPRSKYWDVMDCTAYLVEMLEMGERYMSPQGVEDIESEYKELDADDYYDEPVLDWRVA